MGIVEESNSRTVQNEMIKSKTMRRMRQERYFAIKVEKKHVSSSTKSTLSPNRMTQMDRDTECGRGSMDSLDFELETTSFEDIDTWKPHPAIVRAAIVATRVDVPAYRWPHALS